MPYNPGVTFRGGEYLAAGISRGAHSLAEGFEKYKERKKRENDTASQFVKFAKMYPEMGVDPEELRGMSAREINNTSVAAIAAMHNRQQDAAAREQTEMQAERMKAMVATREQRDAMPGFAEEFANLRSGNSQQSLEGLNAYENSGASGPMPTTGAVSDMDAFVGALRKNPKAASPSMLMQFVNDSTRDEIAQRREEARVKTPRNVSLKNLGPGVRAVVSDTGQFQLVDAGGDENATPHPILDPDGNPTGLLGYRDARGGLKTVKDPSFSGGKPDAQTTGVLLAAKAKALERKAAYKGNLDYANSAQGKKEKMAPPDASELQDIDGDLEIINSQLKGLRGSGGSGGGKPAGTGQKMDITKAGEVKELFRQNKITKEEALKRLRAMGMK